MTQDEISLKEHVDQRFDALEESIDLKIAASLAGYLRWKDLGAAIAGVSAFVGLVILISNGGAS